MARITAALLCHAVPDTQRLEDAPAGIAQRRGAFVEARLRGRSPGGTASISTTRRPAGQRHARGSPRPCRRRRWRRRSQRLGRSHGAHAAAISASISSGSLGAPPVSTSTPSRVTTTSSSMRMPMFHEAPRHALRPAGNVDARLDGQRPCRARAPAIRRRPCSRRRRARPCRASGRCDA